MGRAHREVLAMARLLLNDQTCILAHVTTEKMVDRIIARHVVFLSDPDVTQYLSIPDKSVEFQRNMFLEMVDSSTQCAMAVLLGVVPWNIATLASRYVGMVTLRDIDWQGMTAHSGSMIGDKSLWGGGLGKEAKLLQLHYAFVVMKLRWIYSRTPRSNIRSHRMLEGTGYVLQGTCPNSRRVGDHMDDELHFGVNKEQWRAVWNQRALDCL